MIPTIVAIGSDHGGRIVARGQHSSGKTWQVTAADAFTAVCELAEQVGLELDDA